MSWLEQLGQTFAETVFSGSMMLAMPIALLAGIVSFASPCVLPLLPGYLGYMSAMAGADAGSTAGARRNPKVVWGVILFVLGFTAVFLAMTGVFSAAGTFLMRWEEMITRILGVVVIVMGLAFTGLIPFLQSDRRIKISPTGGLWGTPLLGVVFGLGWAPCIGPTLAAVLALGYDQGQASRALILTFIYSMGLGLPFVIAALGVGVSKKMTSFLRRHRLGVMRFGGVMLILLGLALVTGLWGQLAQWLQGLINSTTTLI